MVWQLATALATGSGMLLVTLAVTYLLSVVSAMVNNRSVASQISALGTRLEEIVVSAWNGQDFGMLNQQLLSIAANLGKVAEQHLAYPIRHAYHTATRQQATAPAVGVLDDALTLLESAVAKPHQPDPIALTAARSAVNSYLGSVHRAGIESAEKPLPLPSVIRLRNADVPVQSKELIIESFNALADRRRRLLGMVKYDAWASPKDRAPSD